MNLSPRPLEEFGGWLRFFQITQWIGVVVCVIAIPLFAIGVLYQFVEPSPKDGCEAFIALADASLSLWIARKILARLKDRDPAAPEEIVRWIKWSLVLAAAVLVLDGSVIASLGSPAWTPDDLATLKMDTKSLQWGAIWWLYFRNSKRVRTYYGTSFAPPAA